MSEQCQPQSNRTSQEQSQNQQQLQECKAITYIKQNTLKVTLVKGKKCTIETDDQFIESIRHIAKTEKSVIQQFKSLKNSNLTSQECQEIHFRAKRHYDANKLNCFSSLSHRDIQENEDLINYYCRCGCDKLQGQSYPINTPLQSISILGSGIILYFYFLKTLIVCLAIFAAIYSIFALSTNLIESNSPLDEKCINSKYCNFRNFASDRSKFESDGLNIIQEWLGLLGVIAWTFLFQYIKLHGAKINDFIHRNLKSSSDFAIKLQNLPAGQYDQYDLIQYINKIYKSKQILSEVAERIVSDEIISAQNIPDKSYSSHVNNSNELENKTTISYSEYIMDEEQVKNVNKKTLKNKIGVKSIQIVYDMEFSRKLLKKIRLKAFNLKSTIIFKHHFAIIKDMQLYLQKKMELINLYEQSQSLKNQFLSDNEFRKSLSNKIAILQFKNKKQKQDFLLNYGSQHLSFFQYFKEYCIYKCYGSDNPLMLKHKIPQISAAPEPTDIIWKNCQKKESILRWLFIYFITLIIILISLCIMTFINYHKPRVIRQESSQMGTESFSRQSMVTLLNITTTLIMQTINALLWLIIRVLLKLQYNHTNTNKIVSLMNKTTMATLINIIVLPIIIHLVMNNYTYYGSEGLSSIVFDYHVSSILVGLLMKFINPQFVVVKIILNVKCFRNYFIKARYIKRNDKDRIQQQQMKKIYSFYDAPDFNIAQSYTFIISSVLHAFFFASLQPILIIFALVEVSVFYLICRYKVFKQCKIPKLTEKLIFNVAIYLMMLIPAFFGGGSILNSYIGNHLYPQRQINIIAPSICIILGIFNYLNPKNIICTLINSLIKCFCLKIEHKFEQQLQSRFESESNARLQTYYKNSNSLDLLGFEKTLLGNPNRSDIEHQLKKYCQSHTDLIGATLQSLGNDQSSICLQKTLESLKREH